MSLYYPQYLLEQFLVQNKVQEVDNSLKNKYLYISGMWKLIWEIIITLNSNNNNFMQNLQTNEAMLQHFQVEELEERL